MLPSIFGESLFDEMMDDVADDFGFEKEWEEMFKTPKKNPLYGKHAKNMMKTDVKETDESYEVDIDLPGFKKGEINVELMDGYLSISANKSKNIEKKDKKSGKFIRKERYSGSMARSFYVGESVQKEDINAKYEDGILKLSVPKSAINKIENTHTIAIEG